MTAPLRSSQLAAEPDEFCILVLDHGTGATLADERRKEGIDLAIRRARALHRRHGGEIARVLLRGFELGYVEGGQWRARPGGPAEVRS